jgi:hypothetical protein
MAHTTNIRFQYGSHSGIKIKKNDANPASYQNRKDLAMTTLAKKYVGFGGFRPVSMISALLQADQAYRSKRHLARLDKTHLVDMGL